MPLAITQQPTDVYYREPVRGNNLTTSFHLLPQPCIDEVFQVTYSIHYEDGTPVKVNPSSPVLLKIFNAKTTKYLTHDSPSGIVAFRIQGLSSAHQKRRFCIRVTARCVDVGHVVDTNPVKVLARAPTGKIPPTKRVKQLEDEVQRLQTELVRHKYKQYQEMARLRAENKYLRDLATNRYRIKALGVESMAEDNTFDGMGYNFSAANSKSNCDTNFDAVRFLPVPPQVDLEVKFCDDQTIDGTPIAKTCKFP